MSGFFTLRGRPTVQTTYKDIPECALPGQHAAIFREFARVVPPKARVLDLASGMGAWAQRLTDQGHDVIACDIRPDLCRVACRPVDLNEGFSENFSLSSFDAVTAIEMLEHIENPRHIIRESYKLLKHGGTLTFSTPNASGLHSRLKFLFTGRFAQFDDEQYNSIGHIRPLTYWELDKILTEVGFRIIHRGFHNNYDYIPRTVGDAVKLLASLFVRPFVRGVVGGQAIIIIAQKI